MSKFSTPFLKKSPILGAYENAADGRAFMGGLVSGQQQFAKLQQDITKGFENYMEGEGTQQRLKKDTFKKAEKRVGKIADKGVDYKFGETLNDGIYAVGNKAKKENAFQKYLK